MELALCIAYNVGCLSEDDDEDDEVEEEVEEEIEEAVVLEPELAASVDSNASRFDAALPESNWIRWLTPVRWERILEMLSGAPGFC